MTTQVQHHLGHAAGQEDAHCRVMHRTVGQNADQSRHAAVNRDPILHRWPRQTRCVRDRRNVQQEIRRPPKGRVHDHRVANGRGREHVAYGGFACGQRMKRLRRPAREVEPDWFAGRREGRMRQRKPQGFAHHLRRCGRAEKLAPTAGRGAGATAKVGRIRERN